jgi:hypothetical protein
MQSEDKAVTQVTEATVSTTTIQVMAIIPTALTEPKETTMPQAPTQ